MGAQPPPRGGAQRAAGAGEARRLFGAGLLVSVLGIAAKALGQLRESVAAALFGATRAMDAFNVAKSIPDMVSSWVETPVRAAVVPLFTRRRHESGEAEAWRAASNIVNTLGLALAIVSALLFAAAGPLTKLFSAGFRDQAAWLDAQRLARIVVASVVFSVLTEILGSLSNVYGRQFVPAFGRLLNGATVLACVAFLGASLGPAAYAWGFLAGSVVYFLLQTDVIWRHRRHYRFTLRPAAPEIREVVTIGLPLFIGMVGPRLDVLLDQTFASFLAAGSLTILYYMRAFSAALSDLVQTVSLSVLLPHFSALVAEGRHEELRGRLTRTLHGYVFLVAPVTVFVCLGARPLVDILYRHGAFGSDAAAIAAIVLPILAVADPAFGIGQILAQVHISAGDTKTPMKVGFWRIGIKAVLSAALVFRFGIVGLAAATSLSGFFRAAELWRRLPRALRPSGRDLVSGTLALLLPAAVSAAGAYAAFRMLPPFPGGLAGQVARAGVAAAVCGALHLAVAFAQGNQTAQWLLRTVRGARH